jgi:hypothetical protein
MEPRKQYGWEHIATDPLHLRDEPRYAVVDNNARSTVATFKWAYEAKDEADRLNIAAGACAQCNGDGQIIADYVSTPVGDLPVSEPCPRCGGTGKEPDDAMSEAELASDEPSDD